MSSLKFKCVSFEVCLITPHSFLKSHSDYFCFILSDGVIQGGKYPVISERQMVSERRVLT